MCVRLCLLFFSFPLQYILPTVHDFASSDPAANWLISLEQLLTLAVPNTYVWLLGFYAFFHVTLNLLAEVTKQKNERTNEVIRGQSRPLWRIDFCLDVRWTGMHGTQEPKVCGFRALRVLVCLIVSLPLSLHLLPLIKTDRNRSPKASAVW